MPSDLRPAATGKSITTKIYNPTVKDLLGASVAVNLDSGYSAVYARVAEENGRHVAKCRLRIGVQSQFGW